MSRDYYARWWDTAYDPSRHYVPYLDQVADAVGDRTDLLDLGCGDGLVLRSLAANGLRVGLDIVPSVDITRDAASLQVIGDGTRLPFRPASFDAVLALEVIEHVFEVHALLQSAHDVLREDGILVVTTPNIRQLPRPLSLLLRGRFPRTSEDPSIYDSGHIRYLTSRDLSDLLRDARFEPVVGYVTHEGKFRMLKRLLRLTLPSGIYGELFAPGLFAVAKKIVV